MELVQGYIDIWQPIQTREDKILGLGFMRGTVTDGITTAEFGFRNARWNVERPTIPIIRYGITQTIATGARTATVEMSILLDNNELYELIGKSMGQRLTFRTDTFEVEGYVEHMDYQHHFDSTGEITADIRILSTGEPNFIQNPRY